MSGDVMEEELLRSIDEVDVQIKNFRNRVRAILSAAQSGGEVGAGGSGSEDSA